MEIDGDWIGHFNDPRVGCPKGGHDFGIRARFSVKNGKLTGTMTDLEPAKAVPCKELYEAQSPRMSSQESSVCKDRLERYPDLVVETILPETSILSGSVDDRRVHFEKHYSEGQRFVWRSGTTIVDTQELPRHKVVYEGVYDPGAEAIRGTWCVPKRGLAGLTGGIVAQGDFELRRAEAS